MYFVGKLTHIQLFCNFLFRNKIYTQNHVSSRLIMYYCMIKLYTVIIIFFSSTRYFVYNYFLQNTSETAFQRRIVWKIFTISRCTYTQFIITKFATTCSALKITSHTHTLNIKQQEKHMRQLIKILARRSATTARSMK